MYIVNMDTLSSQYYISLDSSNKNAAIVEANEMSWYINDTNPKYEKGLVNVLTPIRNITAIWLGTITIACRSTKSYDLLIRERITVLIKELSAQSFIESGGFRFHFIGKVDKVATVPCKSATISFYYFNHGLFEMTKPITRIDQITLSIGAGLTPFNLDPEIIYGVVVGGTSPAQIIFYVEHGMGPNSLIDPIIISGELSIANTYNNYTIVDSRTITVPINYTAFATSEISAYRPVSLITKVKFYCENETVHPTL